MQSTILLLLLSLSLTNASPFSLDSRAAAPTRRLLRRATTASTSTTPPTYISNPKYIPNPKFAASLSSVSVASLSTASVASVSSASVASVSRSVASVSSASVASVASVSSASVASVASVSSASVASVSRSIASVSSASVAATATPSATPGTLLGFTSSGLNLDERHTGQGTYFATGLGACGNFSKDTDYIVAVSYKLFDTFPGAGPNPNLNPICGQKLRATYGGVTIQVEIQDRCADCEGTWNLDLSPTAFNRLAAFDVGRFSGMTWVFV